MLKYMNAILITSAVMGTFVLIAALTGDEDEIVDDTESNE